MSLIVAVNGIFQSYFDPKHKGNINPRKEFSELPRRSLPESKGENMKAYNEGKKPPQKRRVNIYARDIMTKTIYTISPNYSASEAIQQMNQLEVHHLLVKQGKELLGIISDRDLLRNLGNKKKVESFMTKKVLLCRADADIRLIAQVMLEESISCLPIVDDEHNLLGIISRSDLLNCIVRNMPLEVFA